MTESLFTTTPSGGFNDGSPGITTSTTMKFAVTGTITHVRWYVVNPFNGGTWTGLVWEVTATDAGGAGAGTLLGSKAAGATPTVDSWNTIQLDTPIAVATNKLYRVGMHNDSRYCLTNNAFNGTDITNGNITAHRNGADPLGNGWAIRQGAFIVSATTTAYPTQVGSAAAYFVDVLFEPDAAPGSIAPDGIAVAASLGTPSLAQALTIVPSGISVAAALGTHTLTQGGVAPSGISVAAALGTPALAQSLSVTPSGIAVTGGLGTPALVQALAVLPDGIAVPVTLGSPALDQTIEPGFAIAPDGIAVIVTLGTPGVAQAIEQGSWETLSAIAREARIDHQRNQERERSPLDCPEHGWPLQRTPRGLHCTFGGHVLR